MGNSEWKMSIRRIEAMVSTGVVPVSGCTYPAPAGAKRMAMPFGRLKTVLFSLLLLMLRVAPLHAQTISATLSGLVGDQTGAVIPGATVTLINQASNDKRSTTSNAVGYFSFTAVPAATYSILVQSAGFNNFEEKDIELHPSDQRNLTNIKMRPGTVETTVMVSSAASQVITTGERSVLITAEDIKKLPVEGRDVTELIKTLPGFAQVAQGTGADNLAPDPGVVGGQTGNYVANGTTPEGISIVSDGVNITDPGNGASSDQVINMDNVQEVKVQTSNFGADSAKGPIVINAVGKSGGSEYHGSMYVYGRTYQMNTQDWFSKYDEDAKPQDRYIYPGGNIGGPVKIPGTDFNHNKKLVFFASGEDYIQRNVYSYGSATAATVNALLPTAAMRAGDFSAAELSNYFGQTIPDSGCGNVVPLYVNICNPITGQSVSGITIANNQIPNRDLDPGAAAIMNNLVPLPNRAPYSPFASESIYNYHQVNLQNNDSFQTRARVDYSFSDNTKLYVVYDFQYGSGHNPQQIYYSPQQNFGEIDTPSGIKGQDYSHTGSFNFTRVFTSTLTNELYGGVSLNLGGNEVGKKGANLSSTINYPYQGIYQTAIQQYPQLYDYGFDGLPLALFPDYSSPIFQHKFVPNGGDNVTKAYRTHTFKAGFYAERATNNQTDLNVASNGQIQQYYLGPNNGPGNICEPNNVCYPSPGNYLASFMEGEIQQFNQFNFQTNSDLYYWTVDGYVTDSWKYNKKLTLDYGIRIGHVGPWEDAHGLGLAVWDPALYAQQSSVAIVNNVAQVTATAANPGYKWHAMDKSVPNSGAGSTLAFYSPRFGVAYDLRGDSKTVLRGGIGAYRSHDSWNDVNQEQATSQGQTFSTVGGGGLRLQDVTTLAHSGYSQGSAGNSTQSGTSGVGFGLSAGDKQQPLTYTYSFGLSRQVNVATLFELSYQGSQSSHLLTQYEQGASGDLENVNALPIGTLYKPDPLTGEVNSPQGFSTEQHVNNFRPYPFYTQVNVARHILYSNYNAMQASVKRTQGRFNYSFNYTWSKNLGVLGSYSTGNVVDSANIRPNYGPLAYDRSHIFNGTYTYDVGSWAHGGRLVRGIANKWNISGIVNLQSGPNAQRVLGSNLGLGGQVPIPSQQQPQPYYTLNNLTYLGTPDVVLQPTLTCDPRHGLKSHQYINVNCFALPQFGVNGQAQFPYIHTPGFFNTDARLGKQFQMGEKRSLQFQLSAFNVINRPNYSFSSKFPSEQELYYGATPNDPSKYAFPTEFGSANFRFGRRVTEISARYDF